MVRLTSLKFPCLFLLLAAVAVAASDPVASRLAKMARQAQSSGQLVRAYLLYAEAAARDPQTIAYTSRREELAPAAKMLMKAEVVNTDISPDIKQAETGASETSPITPVSHSELIETPALAPPPHLTFRPGAQSFNLFTDQKAALTQVAAAYGVSVMFDPSFDSKPGTRLTLDEADFKTAMDAVSLATNTFLFPISERTLFAARDTEAKRRQYEPVVTITVPLPYSIETKDVIETANAVRGVLTLRTIGWDSIGHTVIIRDRIDRARAAESLFNALMLPKGQVSLRVQLMTTGASSTYHYGLSLPTSVPLVTALEAGDFQTTVSTATSLATDLIFNVGSFFFGIGLTNANLFAMYTSSNSTSLYDATVLVSDGQTAAFHVGEKYPIPTAIYTGASQSSGLASLNNPIGQVNLEDLGLLIKVGAHVTGDQDVSLELEAESKALGTAIIDSVPSIAQRTFKGSVRLRPGEWAVLAGLNSDSVSNSRSGILGLSSIAGLNQVLSENTRSHIKSDLLIVIKPTITTLPMSNGISPQYLLGPQRGWRVIL